MSAVQEKKEEVVQKEEEKNKDKETMGEKEKDKDSLLSSAHQHLSSGKRHLLVQDIPAAVSSFAESCKIFGDIYGENGVECGEAFFFYGKALLELARVENGVLENVLDGVPPSEDESELKDADSGIGDPAKLTNEEAIEISDKVGEAIVENYKELEKIKEEAKKKEQGKDKDKEEEDKQADSAAPSPDPKEGKDKDEKKDQKKNDESEENSAEDEAEAESAPAEDQKEGEDEKEAEEGEGEDEEEGEEEEGAKENESIGSNDAGTSDVKEKEDKSAVEQEDEDDPSNLQLAWEMLELAKNCFQKHADSLQAEDPKRMEMEDRLCETYMFLGEVSIENENYAQSVEDLTSCLRRRQELLPDDSRSIAETHYQMGVAQGFNLDFDAAVGSLEDAIAVLQKRVQNLKEKKESKDPLKKDDAFYTREKEIEEIESLIPEIREKIADTRDMQEETHKKLGDRVLMEEKELEAISSAATSKKTANGHGLKNGSADAATMNGSGGDSGKAASDISHMLKKRKKSDDKTEATESKKPHVEEQPAADTAKKV